MYWQLQDAKARFSELVKKAVDEGPQTVTRRGEPTVVIVDAAYFERLTADGRDVLDVLMSGPEEELALPSRQQRMRDVEW